jgi:flagellar biosynthesis protein FlhF
MRIKRYTAPDMRSALRMVRDEQGPDAVILSNRVIAGGVEVVSATDYDEALVQQALRAAVPGLEPLPAKSAAHDEAAFPLSAKPTAHDEAAFPPFEKGGQGGFAVAAPMATNAPANIAVASATATAPPARAANASRPSLAERARAVFRIGGDAGDNTGHGDDNAPTLAQLVTAQPRGTTATPPHSEAPPRLDAPRFDAMMAALGAVPATTVDAADGNGSTIAITTAAAEAAAAATAPPEAAITHTPHPALRATLSPLRGAREEQPLAPRSGERDSFAQRSRVRGAYPCPEAEAATIASREDTTDAVAQSMPLPIEVADADNNTDPTPTLRAVAGRDLDPAVAAMRDELSAMRQLIERELGQLTVERLRGSPARAAAYDALIDAGCDAALAQDVAAKIDPALDPARAHAAMLAQFGQRLTVARAEPIDDGGVIALIGPTGAGKTTTLAKLAARFAERHRARDVALVTTDQRRAGAREQLQAHGRRLGITVCEADGPEGLPATLAQLADYPLVLVDTAGHATRGRAMLGQLAWLRGDSRVRSLLVLPANANPHDLDDVVRRYRLAMPEGVVLTKLDETGRLGAALSMAVRNELSLAYVCDGQDVPGDIAPADIPRLLLRLSRPRRGDASTSSDENRHAVA